MKYITLTQENLHTPENFRLAPYHRANLYMDTFAEYMHLCHTQKAYEARLEYSDMTSWAKCLALDESHPGRPLPRKLYQALTLAVTGMYAGLLEERRALAILIRVLLRSEELQQSIFGCTVKIEDDVAVNGFLFVLFHELDQVMLYQTIGQHCFHGEESMPSADKLAERSDKNFDAFLDTLRNAVSNASNRYLPALVRYYRKCERDYHPVPKANEAEAYRQLDLPYPAVKDEFDVRYVADIPIDEDAAWALLVCLRCSELIYYKGDMSKAMDGDCPQCGAPLRYNPED